jgi:NitT/TauT family transport system substrate-binding protein
LQELTLLLPFLESIFYSGITIARERGYFADEGLVVTTEDTGGSAFVTQQIVGGGFEYGYNTPAETLVALSTGVDVRLVFNQEYGNIFDINVLADSDVQTLADLEGRTLGITDFGGGEVPLVQAALASVGLVFDEDVSIQVVGPGGPLAFNSLSNGDVDAFAGAVNDWAALTGQGLELRSILPPEFGNQPGDVLMVPTATYESPEGQATIVGLLRAISRGFYFGQLNHDAGLCIMKGFLPEEHEDPVFARSYYEEVVALQTPPDPAQWGLQDIGAWEFIQDLLVESGGITEPLDLNQFIKNELIAPINEWDRAVVEADAESATVTYPDC